MKKIVTLLGSLLLAFCGRISDYTQEIPDIGQIQADSTTIENLEILCKVWGFVKYHHPVFCQMRPKINMDWELLNLLPQVATAVPNDRNRILSEWVDSFGKFKDASERYRQKLSQGEYEQTANCSWTADTSELGCVLSKQLSQLRYADRKPENRFIEIYQSLWIKTFKENTSNFNGGTGKQLLTLFRYWNIIEYFFPYRNITNTPWHDVLNKYIPLFLAPTKDTYLQAVAQLVSEVNDTHANRPWGIVGGNYSLPLQAQFVEDKLIIIDAWKRSHIFKPGDEIMSIDGQTPEEVLELTQKYCAYSNQASLRRVAAENILKVKNWKAKVSFKRDGKIIDTTVGAMRLSAWGEELKEHRLNLDVFRMLNDSVGYLYPAEIDAVDNISGLFDSISRTKVLIVDHRCYPLLMAKIIHHFINAGEHVTTCTKPMVELPGYFEYIPVVRIDIKTESPYKGQIIVLVNERSQSMCEYSTMMLQTRPSTVVIGSQTAGTDGNVGSIPLPGGMETFISGIGVYYPDKTPTQRCGVKIDYEIYPTIEGIREGRDELLEKAMEIIALEAPENLKSRDN